MHNDNSHRWSIYPCGVSPFRVYIYQRWIYRVDLTRVNEFGTSGLDHAGIDPDAAGAPMLVDQNGSAVAAAESSESATEAAHEDTSTRADVKEEKKKRKSESKKDK